MQAPTRNPSEVGVEVAPAASEDDAEDVSESCTICMSRARAVRFLPCRHAVMCEDCTIAEMQRTGKCSNCRRPVEGLVFVPVSPLRPKRLKTHQDEPEPEGCYQSVQNVLQQATGHHTASEAPGRWTSATSDQSDQSTSSPPQPAWLDDLVDDLAGLSDLESDLADLSDLSRTSRTSRTSSPPQPNPPDRPMHATAATAAAQSGRRHQPRQGNAFSSMRRSSESCCSEFYKMCKSCKSCICNVITLHFFLQVSGIVMFIVTAASCQCVLWGSYVTERLCNATNEWQCEFYQNATECNDTVTIGRRRRRREKSCSDVEHYIPTFSVGGGSGNISEEFSCSRYQIIDPAGMEQCKQMAANLVGSVKACNFEEDSDTCYPAGPHDETTAVALQITGIVFLAIGLTIMKVRQCNGEAC